MALSRGVDCDGGGGVDDLSFSSDYDLQAVNGSIGNENGGFSAQIGNSNWERANKGVESGERMDSQGGGEADASGWCMLLPNPCFNEYYSLEL